MRLGRCAYPPNVKIRPSIWTSALVATLATGGAALAQEDVRPPDPPIDKNQVSSPALGYGVIVLCLVMVVAVSIMPSKRTHLD